VKNVALKYGPKLAGAEQIAVEREEAGARRSGEIFVGRGVVLT